MEKDKESMKPQRGKTVLIVGHGVAGALEAVNRIIDKTDCPDVVMIDGSMHDLKTSGAMPIRNYPKFEEIKIDRVFDEGRNEAQRQRERGKYFRSFKKR